MAEAGRRGEKVHSDCWIRFEPGGDGIRVNLRSKVEALYGAKIRRQIECDLKTMGVSAGQTSIEDTGALPYVISARLETAVRRSGFNVKSTVLPKRKAIQENESQKDRLRRSRLYVPGNMPHYFINAGLYRPDGIILDLEDSVAPAEKDAARLLVRNALIEVDLMGAERMVRINPVPAGIEDLEWIAPYGVQLVLIPKCESTEQVRQVDEAIRLLESERVIWLMPIIETALGCFKALEIATASERVAALSLGLEDYAADTGIARTERGLETLWARQTVVNAAKAAGVQASDTVFTDGADPDGLLKSALEAKSFGYDGKGCIHPKQIKVVHTAFAPTDAEVKKAEQIVRAYEEAQASGSGVVALDGKMIDAPVVKRALRVMKLKKMSD